SADAAAKPTSPMISIRRLPNRSDSRPPSSSRLPNASEYAVTTHCRSALEKFRALWAEGSAIFTIVASRTTISCATPTTASTHQRSAGLAAAPGDLASPATADGAPAGTTSGSAASLGRVMAPSRSTPTPKCSTQDAVSTASQVGVQAGSSAGGNVQLAGMVGL